MPPFTEIKHLVQAHRLVKKLPFVNQRPASHVRLTRVDNLVEWNYTYSKSELKIRSARKRSLKFQELRSFSLEMSSVYDGYGHDDRAIVVADRSAMWQQGVLVRT
jgi:hypothetical protein